MSEHKFSASNKHRLVVRQGMSDGGLMSGESDLVCCDRDFQPHYENSHTSQNGNALACENPIEWKRGGIKMEKDVPLDF